MQRNVAEIVIRAAADPALREFRRVDAAINSLRRNAMTPMVMPTGMSAGKAGYTFVPGQGFMYIGGSGKGGAAAQTPLDDVAKGAPGVEVAGAALTRHGRAIEGVRGAYARAAAGAAAFGRSLFTIQGIAGAYGMSRLVRSASSAASEIERLRRSFAIFYGDAVQGNRELRKVIEYGKVTMFTATEVAEAKRLLRAYQIDSERALHAVADTAAATGYELQSVAMALGRLRSGVFGEGMELLRRIGITRKELEGEGLRFNKAGMFLGDPEQAVEGALRAMIKRFDGYAVEMNKTWQGRLSTFRDSWAQAVAPLGEQLHQAIMPWMDKLSVELEAFANNAAGIPKLIAEGASAETILGTIERKERDWQDTGGWDLVGDAIANLTRRVAGGIGAAIAGTEALVEGHGIEGARVAGTTVLNEMFTQNLRELSDKQLEAELAKYRVRMVQVADYSRGQGAQKLVPLGDMVREQLVRTEIVERQKARAQAITIRDRLGTQADVQALARSEERRTETERRFTERERIVEVERKAITELRSRAEQQPPRVAEGMRREAARREVVLQPRVVELDALRQELEQTRQATVSAVEMLARRGIQVYEPERATEAIRAIRRPPERQAAAALPPTLAPADMERLTISAPAPEITIERPQDVTLRAPAQVTRIEPPQPQELRAPAADVTIQASSPVRLTAPSPQITVQPAQVPTIRQEAGAPVVIPPQRPVVRQDAARAVTLTAPAPNVVQRPAAPVIVQPAPQHAVQIPVPARMEQPWPQLQPQPLPRARDAAMSAPKGETWWRQPGREFAMYEQPAEAVTAAPVNISMQSQQTSAPHMSASIVDNRTINVYAGTGASGAVGMARQYWER